jgi:hypothetical protein
MALDIDTVPPDGTGSVDDKDSGCIERTLPPLTGSAGYTAER